MMTRHNDLKPDTRMVNPQQCRVVSAVEIPADAQSVWSIVGNFGGFQAFVSALESTEVTGVGPGSIRNKRFKDGNVAIEQLNSRDDDALCMTWSLVYTSLPVGNLWAAMTVEPTDAHQCIATWTIIADQPWGSTDPLSSFETFLQGFADGAMNNVRGLFV